MNVILKIMTICLIIFMPSGHLNAQTENTSPPIAAALTIKVAAFEKHLSTTDEISIFVLKSDEVASELMKGIGTKIGNATLTRVESGDTLPDNIPSLLFIGEGSDLFKTLAYTRNQKIMSVTHINDYSSKGVTICLGVGQDGKPQIILNLTSTIEEGLSWNPAIMKVAKTVK
jgi:hypothetical protein